MEHGGAMLKDFCEAMDIEQETYYQWMKKTEFSNLINSGEIASCFVSARKQ